MITWEDIPGNEQIALRKAFEDNPEIKKLRYDINQLTLSRHYIESLNLNKYVDKLWEEVKASHIANYQKSIEQSVKLSEIGLSQKDIQTVVENILIVFMCCDIIETADLNANEVLKRFDSSYSMDNFCDLKNFIQRIKLQLEFLKRETSYMNDFLWGDSCDKHYEMIRNKARSIITKKGNINLWGQSLKKYLEEHKDAES